MAREKKPIGLRMVDDTPVPELEVLRLGTEPQPVRLIPANPSGEQGPVARLAIPVAETLDSRRSHEPGLEVLLDPELLNPATGEETWGGVSERREPVPWGWFALLGLLLTGAVSWSVSHIKKAEPRVEEAYQQAVEVANDVAASDLALTQLLQRLEKTIQLFCEATTLEAMQPLVRHAERVRPLMERFYAQQALQPLGFDRIRNLHGAVMDSKRNFWELAVVVGDGKKRDFLLEETADGSVRVDWETAVNYQPMDWDEYARQRPPGTTLDFRVLVDEDHFFSHEFANSAHWMSFRLTTRTGEETLFGYAPRGGPVATALLALIQEHATHPVPTILRLSLPPDLQSHRGLIIEKVLSTRWVYVDPPDSDT